MDKAKRGSEKLLAAWRARTLSDEAIKEIAVALDKSPAKLELANVVGGASASGVTLSLVYTDDDVPMCGNDIHFWLNWLRKHGGKPRPPRIFINGIPFPDWLRVELDFGHPGPGEGPLDEIGSLRGGGGRIG